MAVKPRLSAGRSRWLAIGSAVLGFVAVSCRIGYDPLSFSALATGGEAAGGSTVIGSGGGAGDSAAGGSTAAGSGGLANSTGGGNASGGALGDSGSAGSSGSGAVDGGACNAGACSCESFGGHAYWFCGTPTARADASAACASGGLSLVRIDDSAENAWILGTATSLGLISPTKLPSDLLFTGANDLAQADNWQWDDGVQFWSGGSSGTAVGGLYANWASSNPQTSSTRRCAGMFFDGGWQSRSCTALQPYVCKDAP